MLCGWSPLATDYEGELCAKCLNVLVRLVTFALIREWSASLLK